MTRRTLAALLLATASSLAMAQTWPSKPIRMVIPYPPGGPTDILGRIVAQQLEGRLGGGPAATSQPGRYPTDTPVRSTTGGVRAGARRRRGR